MHSYCSNFTFSEVDAMLRHLGVALRRSISNDLVDIDIAMVSHQRLCAVFKTVRIIAQKVGLILRPQSCSIFLSVMANSPAVTLFMKSPLTLVLAARIAIQKSTYIIIIHKDTSKILLFF